jgi:hypothetical protein
LSLTIRNTAGPAIREGLVLAVGIALGVAIAYTLVAGLAPVAVALPAGGTFGLGLYWLSVGIVMTVLDGLERRSIVAHAPTRGPAESAAFARPSSQWVFSEAPNNPLVLPVSER